jgi:phosphoglycerate dehydrogenase-like enzyme
MSLYVHYLEPPGGEVLDTLRANLAPGIWLTSGSTEPVPANTDILIAGRPKREHLTASPTLRALIIPWAGLPPETGQLLGDFPQVTVHNLHHNAAPVAELAFSLLLAAAKFVVPLDRSLRSQDWTPRYRPSPALLLAGKTALILGYGAIGQRVAIMCKSLGMVVLATRRSPKDKSDGVADEIHSPAALLALLPRCNALIICLPHTRETDGLIGEDELDLLPTGAILVNIGRGPIVDEAALYNALLEGHLHSAGLDVWYNYPPDEESRSQTAPSAYPFDELDNVVMSPHRGGATTETNSLRMGRLADLLNAAAAGRPIPNWVDLAAGY